MNKKSTDVNEIKTLLIITAIIILISVGLYFFTEASLNKKDAENNDVVPDINYTETIIGNMFDIPLKKYYVLAYDKKADNASKYESLYVKYLDKEDAIDVYEIDLSLGFNAFALKDKSNKKPTKASEVAINEAALILMENGKVSKYYETIEEMEKAFK